MLKKNICFFVLISVLFSGVPYAANAEDSMDFDVFAETGEDFDVGSGEETPFADIADTICGSDIDLNDFYDLNADASVANVASFDIAGIMLGMQFEDVQTLFFKTKGLYTPREKNSIIYTLHNDWKANLDYECRSYGVVVPAKIESCINSLARNRGLLYASELHLTRQSTGENIVVCFTSNATDNRVWRVIYTNDVNEQEGIAKKFEKQRENKILAFWQNVLDKFGAPNSGEDRWVSSTNSYDPTMVAYFGKLDLIDYWRFTSDSSKNILQARENFKAKPYAF